MYIGVYKIRTYIVYGKRKKIGEIGLYVEYMWTDDTSNMFSAKIRVVCIVLLCMVNVGFEKSARGSAGDAKVYDQVFYRGAVCIWWKLIIPKVAPWIWYTNTWFDVWKNILLFLILTAAKGCGGFFKVQHLKVIVYLLSIVPYLLPEGIFFILTDDKKHVRRAYMRLVEHMLQNISILYPAVAWYFIISVVY